MDDAIVTKNRRAFGEEDIIEMNNGCICCTVRGDLIRILTSLLERKGPRLDAILIETTGLADPGEQGLFGVSCVGLCICVGCGRVYVWGVFKRVAGVLCGVV